MKIKNFTILLLLLVLSSSISTFGQIRPRDRQPTRPTTNGQQNQQQQDTTKVSKRPGAILDDTTRNIYGPKTTLQLYEIDVLEGRYREMRIDTSIYNIHNQRYWFPDTTYYQDLGNVGTAAQPLLYHLPTRIGIRLGKNAFDRYAYNPGRINYFDTRSPYSHLYYVQGQRGEQIFEATYARNITKHFNFGVAYQIISADKQIGTTSLRDDGLIDNQAVKAFTHYRSKNDRYDLFANYTHLNHEQIETGGVKPADADDTPDSLFRYENELVYLSQAATEELRHTFHVLQMFKLATENLKVYHRFDWRTQNTTYSDDAIPFSLEEGQLDFYPDVFYSNARTKDQTEYREFENEFGFTGNTSISFYKAYIKQRSGKINYSAIETIKPDTIAVGRVVTSALSENQLFLGGQVRLNYKDKYILSGEGEYQLADNYRLRASGRFKGLEFTQTRVRQSPTLVEQRYLSNHFIWDNDFKATITDQSSASFQHQFGDRQFIRLAGAFTNISRLVIFNTDAEPEQLNVDQQLLEAQLMYNLRVGSFHFDNMVNYTNTENAGAIRIPEWVVDSKLYFEGAIFKNALFSQIGVQLYMPTGYRADAYMPVTQQFYLQNDFTTKTYPVFDVFLNADIKTVNVFVKMAHVNYDIWEPGYYVTPGYPGLRRSFTFGVKWMFFD